MNKEGELLLAGFFRSFQVTRAGRSIGDEEWCFLRGEERSNVTRKSNLRSDPSRVTVKFYFFSFSSSFRDIPRACIANETNYNSEYRNS